MHATTTPRTLARTLRRSVRFIPILGALALATTGVVLATPGSGLTTTNVSVGRFDEIAVHTHVDGHKASVRTKGASDIHVVSNVFEPGGQTGWHTHPGPSLITVKSGTITVYDGHDPTCTPTVYPAGSGFLDPGDGHVHVLRNEGTTAAETIAVQILPQGAVRRIDAPDPGFCDF